MIGCMVNGAQGYMEFQAGDRVFPFLVSGTPMLVYFFHLFIFFLQITAT